MRTLSQIAYIASLTTLATITFLATPALLQAQESSGAEPNGQPRITQASRTAAPPVIDGRLDDDAWVALDALSGFTQREPTEGQPVSQRTEVRIVHDDAALYIGAWLFDEDPGGIVVGQTLRDASLNDSDAFVVVLDTYLDRQNGFVFGTTPAGIEYDGQVIGEGVGGGPGGGRQQRGSGGVNFERKIRRNSEQSMWAPVPRQFGVYRISLAGTLAVEAPSRRTVTVSPYALADGFKDYRVVSPEVDYGRKFGGDVKLGINQSLTLDLTVNTDFAQAEVDDQQVNLTRFSLLCDPTPCARHSSTRASPCELRVTLCKARLSSRGVSSPAHQSDDRPMRSGISRTATMRAVPSKWMRVDAVHTAVATVAGGDVLGDLQLPSYGELVAHPAVQRANSHGTEHVIGKEAIP